MNTKEHALLDRLLDEIANANSDDIQEAINRYQSMMAAIQMRHDIRERIGISPTEVSMSSYEEAKRLIKSAYELIEAYKPKLPYNASMIVSGWLHTADKIISDTPKTS